MRRMILGLTAMLLASCAPTPPPSEPPGPTDGRLYIAKQDDIRPVLTPKDSTDNVWGYAPNIDEHYGGVLYEGTPAQIDKDPRPALVDGDQPLRMWVADPNDGRTGRPAILWFHGGGFAVGVDSMYGGARNFGAQYAKRGYVSFSMEYRLDTTLFGGDRGASRPASLCQWVQQNWNPGDPVFDKNMAQCERNITAATHDALAAVRYVRANADKFGIDPNKVVVAGFSAGAVMASNAAYQWDDIGTVKYFPGDPLTAAASRPNATLGASGCTYTVDRQPPRTIDSNDVPFSGIASKFDPAVSYDCVRNTIAKARSENLVAEMASYCDERGHAQKLYQQHLDATDKQWTTFMTRELGIYDDVAPYKPTALCAP